MEMNYEIVTLEEKRAAGLKIRTSNSDPAMGAEIGGLWERFFQTGLFFQIPGKVNEKSIGLYTNYAGDEQGAYDMYACCETTAVELPPNASPVTISGGKYAKFIVRGNMVTAVQEFWCRLWNMDLDRKFDCDFEEYQPGGTEEACEIHMYISLNRP